MTHSKGQPITNYQGEMCGLCDSRSHHQHETFHCDFCGKEGLLENWGAHRCKREPAPKPKPRRTPAVEALIEAAREIVAYGAAGGPEYLFWEEKYSALERALAAVDKEAP